MSILVFAIFGTIAGVYLLSRLDSHGHPRDIVKLECWILLLHEHGWPASAIGPLLKVSDTRVAAVLEQSR